MMGTVLPLVCSLMGAVALAGGIVSVAHPWAGIPRAGSPRTLCFPDCKAAIVKPIARATMANLGVPLIASFCAHSRCFHD